MRQRKKGERVGKSYDIRIKRKGSDWMGEKLHAWGFDSKLPEAWSLVKNDPDVVRAAIFRSTERKKRANKRRSIDEYRCL